MELELKHLAPYLPYKLKVEIEGDENIHEMVGLDITRKGAKLYSPSSSGEAEIELIKPILRPLKDLKKEEFLEQIKSVYQPNLLGIEVIVNVYDSGNNDPNDFSISVSGKMMGDVFTDLLVYKGSVSETPYYIVERFIENHFDINGLIEKGLAIDINKVKY